MKDLINKLDLYFGKKAPQIPKEIREIIVKIAPYLTIIGVVMMLLSILPILGLGSLYSSFGFYGSYYGHGFGGWGIYAIFSIAMLVLYILALPGLFKKTASGWNFIFYAVLVSALQSLLMMNIVGLLLSLLIGFWILFQIKAYYFGGATIAAAPAEAEAKTPEAAAPGTPAAPATPEQPAESTPEDSNQA